MTLLEAIEADRGGAVEVAADKYEVAMLEDPKNLVSAINLAVLYWQCTDYGFVASQGLPPTFVARSGTRLAEIFATLNQKMADRPEVKFWSKYIAWADLGSEFELADCRTLLRLHPHYLEPAMHLFASTTGREAGAEALRLLRDCKSENTIRARYVASVVEAVRRGA